MSNYIEYKNTIAFHPGYFIKEVIDDIGLTQEDFAKRLGTTPKNLSVLIRGEQSLSRDMAMKMSRMMGTSINYWLNLQTTYDTLVAEIEDEKELEIEKSIFKFLDYTYFRDNFNLPDLPRKIEEQIKEVRRFLKVSSLSVLANKDMAVSFRQASEGLSEKNIIRANAMVQIAINKAMESDAPKFDKGKFEAAVEYALTQTCNYESFVQNIEKAFYMAGVVFVVLPNLTGSKVNGATKKIGNKVLLLVDDRRGFMDTFWFTLMHEAGHIVNGDYGISFEHCELNGEKEVLADKYAADKLIPPEAFEVFIEENNFSPETILRFAEAINRNPGIVVGRLQKEEKVAYGNTEIEKLRSKYKYEVSSNQKG